KPNASDFIIASFRQQSLRAPRIILHANSLAVLRSHSVRLKRCSIVSWTWIYWPRWKAKHRRRRSACSIPIIAKHTKPLWRNEKQSLSDDGSTDLPTPLFH